MPGFFDMQESLLRPKSSLADDSAAPKVMTVSQLTAQITRTLKSAFPSQVLVKGEVSNCSINSGSGHIYFTLKEGRDCIDCVLFNSDARRLKCQPTSGLELIVAGTVDVYGPRGRYQLKVQSLQPSGQGALELAFRQLKARLEAEGLFDPHRKKPLPLYPIRLALVTSRQAAGLQDILKVLHPLRFLHLYLYHVPVQGDAAGQKIADALTHLNASAGQIGGVDAILLGRGGGSLEDLWAFNEECVARAIAASRIPIITGIGHEVDVSIADLVADYHAHTPTKAAEVVIQHWKQARQTLEYAGTRIRTTTRNFLRDARQRLGGVERHELFRRPLDRINTLRQLVDDRQRALGWSADKQIKSAHRRMETARQRLEGFSPASILARRRQLLHNLEGRLRQATTGPLRHSQQRLDRAAASLAANHPRRTMVRRMEYMGELEHRLNRAAVSSHRRMRTNLDMLEKHLNALGPQQVLRRGYTMTLDRKGQVIRHARELQVGDRLLTRFADGEVESTVRDARQGELFP
jgi:exodeoxyribonuclease VII large subunit